MKLWCLKLIEKTTLAFTACLFAASLLWSEPGEVLWSYNAGGTLYATPAVGDDGTIYVSVDIEEIVNYITYYSGKICAINPDGSEKWVIDNLEDWVDSAPTVGSSGYIYFGSWDGILYIYRDMGTYAQYIDEFDTESAGVSMSAAIDESGNVYFGALDGICYSLNSNHQERWIHPGNIESPPVIGSDGSIYYGSAEGWLYKLDNNGNELAVYQGINPNGTASESSVRIRTAPMLDLEGNVYFGSADTKLYCVDSDLNLQWSFDTGDKVDSSPVLGPEGNVYFASRDGYLYALDTDGNFLWAAFVGDVFYSSPVVDSAGNVYIVSFVGNSQSALYAYNSYGDFLWSRIFSDLVDASLTITENGVLYLASYNGNLYAIEAEAGLADTPWPKFQRDLANTGQAQIGEPPAIQEHPQIAICQVGGNFFLRVTATGTEPLEYQWIRNGDAFLGNGSEFELRGAMLTDGGYYKVSIINNLGLVTSQTALVTIAGVPYLENHSLVLPYTVPVVPGSETVTVQAASPDLSTWNASPVTSQTETLNDALNLIRAAVPVDDDQLFLRIEATTGE